MRSVCRSVVERRHTSIQAPVGIPVAPAMQVPFIGVEPGTGAGGRGTWEGLRGGGEWLRVGVGMERV